MGMAKYKKTDAYKAFQQKKKARKFGKKPKDKNAPKRPSTAFFIFANEIREDVREENPDASIGQIGKILGQEWGNLDEDRKEAYKAQNEKAKAKYQKALAAWKQAKKEGLKALKAEAKKNNKKKVVKR